MREGKEFRERIGYTRASQLANARLWFSLAFSFHAAAELLSDFAVRIPNDTRPFAYNSAFSIELVLKAILAKKKLPIPDGGHSLLSLCREAGVVLSDNQRATLELLSEAIVWSGRYPAPKKDEGWDRYHDQVFERHIIRSQEDNVFKAMANPDTFPTWENYEKIWKMCVAEYESTRSP